MQLNRRNLLAGASAAALLGSIATSLPASAATPQAGKQAPG